MIWTLVIGLIIGVVAKFLMPGHDGIGFIMTIILGIGGAMFASWAGSSMGMYRQGEPVGFIAAVVGAMTLLFLYRLISSKNRSN